VRVSITGHTNGIGEALADHLRDVWNADVTGFSLSNGFDISKEIDRKRIVEVDYDLFINNAYDYHNMGNGSQLEMLKLLNLTKTIVNISSAITDSDYDKGEVVLQYEADKKALDDFCLGKPITNIKPATLNTRMSGNSGKELSVMCDVIDFVLQDKINIHTITFS
jgi:hypothetical protein